MRKAIVIFLCFAVFSALGAGAAFSECSKDKGCCTSAPAAAAKGQAAATVDPVCGMEVNPSDCKYSSQYQDKTYYFCNSSCKKKFDKNPAKYLKTLK